nr:PE family protein [Mycobacterium lacus]
MAIDSAAGDIGSQVVECANQGLQAGVTASNSLTALPPAGAEEVSAQAVAAFTTEAAQMVALNQAAQEELIRAGSTISEIARMYADADATAANSVVGVSLQWGYRLATV